MLINIALAQTYPSLGNIEKNSAQIAALVEKTSADLLIFPELATTGYMLKDQVADLAPQSAQQRDQLCALSHNQDIVLGGIQTDQARSYNAAWYMSKQKIVHTHRKLYLPTYGMFDEKRYFAEGNQIRAFDTRFGRMAILICEDAWHLSSGYLAALDGAEYLIIISASPYRVGIDQTWKELCLTQAKAFALTVIYCNRVGVEDGVTFWGGSMVVAPDGTILAQAKQLTAEVLTLSIDTAKAKATRQFSPFIRDEKKAVVLKELERIWRDEH